MPVAGRVLEQQMAEVLAEVIKTIFPLASTPEAFIKKHVWRDRKYLGEVNGKVAAWRGLSANLVQLDFRYRAVFVDLVENVLPVHERYSLFGRTFVEHTLKYERFIVLFVLDFPLDSEAEIDKAGLVVRRMNRSLHACVVASVDEFLYQSVSHWVAKAVRLVLLQRVLSTHRKPLDANEVPFQHLLYNTGYLHSHIVKGGLELHSLSRPRKAGDFGHDFHAIVANPNRGIREPFSLGVEVYNAAMGYHVDSIPSYVNRFGLNSMIVIAKDDPYPPLLQVEERFPRPIRREHRLADIGHPERIGIYHLPLDTVVFELQATQEEIGALLVSL